MKIQYRIALEIFIIIMIVIALHHCNSNPQPINLKETKVNEQIAGKVFKEQLNKVKIVEKQIPIYKIRYKTLYDTIYKEAPDTCHYYLAKLNAEKLAGDSVNYVVIKAYGNVIDAGIIYLAKKDSVIKEQDAVIDSLVHNKKKYWRGVKHGFFAGVIASGAVYVGSKFIK